MSRPFATIYDIFCPIPFWILPAQGGFATMKRRSDEVKAMTMKIKHFIASPFSILFYIEQRRTLPDTERVSLAPAQRFYFHDIMAANLPLLQNPSLGHADLSTACAFPAAPFVAGYPELVMKSLAIWALNWGVRMMRDCRFG